LTRWQKFKRWIWWLCAIYVGPRFFEILGRIKGKKHMSKMMLGHHPQCNVRASITGDARYKCDCYMSYIHQERKELDKYREQAKKKDRGIW